jgi:ribosomal protein S18 acetylase RimI-like enzyme
VSNLQSAQGATIRRLSSLDEEQVLELALLLIDCVHGGSSVGFMSPLPEAKASAFWRGVESAVSRGDRALLVAEEGGIIVGTVQLILQQPENQPHRADVSKMLVLRRARRRGIGAALMRAAESVAGSCGKSLLVLDTADSNAERLYSRLGWQRVGTIPGYALLPAGGLCDTHYFYRTLAAARDAPASMPAQM